MTEEIERIRRCARHSIGRAFLFALLAIGATISGLIGWPVMAFRTGAVLTMLTAVIMLLRATRAGSSSYRRTETWILLGRRHALPEARAHAVITGILSETYWRFAEYAGILAAGFWLATFAVALLG
jgi:hypothetical protein